MVMSALYILDLKGKIIISRSYRGDISKSAALKFSIKIQESEESELKPVYTVEGVTYVYIKLKNVYFMAVTKQNSNVALILMFLERLGELMKEYFGSVEEESIRDNFILIYELLDEVMDFGYPQIVESKILKEYITQEGHKSKKALVAPQAVTNRVGWRPEGIVHKNNEVFLDVVEKLNLLVSSTGAVLHSEIVGAVKMRSQLSGMPDVKLGLNDKVMFETTGKRTKGKAVEMEDIKFHQCVRLGRFEHDRTISFIPPDGAFDLMTYRLNTHVKPLIWVETTVEPYKNSRIEYLVKCSSHFKERSIANGVEILIPCPPDVDSPVFKAGIGTVEYAPDLDCIRWTIKQLYGRREYLLRAHFGLPSISAEDSTEDSWRKPIRVTFEIPYFTVSGVQVRYLKVVEASGYQALPWVRYITENGDYQLRMT